MILSSLSPLRSVPEHRPTEPPRTGAASAAGAPELELVPGWFKGMDAVEKSVLFFTLAL